ncbi:Uncharacterized membrane protein [Muriicola jejuensis]|uniref:DUF819 family protein n=1 Tax=Muriicola jejuensis TaxID=504488 RepID=UPI001954990B|nr:DUF819 family protein [Muriicola jejuensis]SMP03073.1 Uncharacterized membrane protein [Muriicola jejuensis]
MIVPWLITLFTVVAVFFLDRWENRHIRSLFDWVPAILLAYLIPAIISHLAAVDYSQAGIHDFSRDYFIPLAIVAVMSSLSLGQLRSIGWKPILLFVSGSFFIALFPVLPLLVLAESDLVTDTLVNQGYWKGIPPIVGGWIGGSTSQLVLKELVECPEAIFLSVLVMDNILVNIWTILMFQSIKGSNALNRFFRITDTAIPESLRMNRMKTIRPWLTLAVLLGTVVLVNLILDSFIGKVILLSVIGLAISNLWPRWNFNFALRSGSVLILIVMAVLGLKLQFATLGFNTAFLGFMAVWLVGHFLFMTIVAKLLNVHMAWVPIASMANVGGIATAPAVTAAYEKKWMPHAVVLAILSMATGTFWGMLTIFFLESSLL